jgi:hypothetical protein
MRRSLPIIGVLFLALPALAESPAPGAGRYAIQPSDDGFVRLDTETGSVSHCQRKDGVWYCTAAADDRAALDGQLAALTDKVASLASAIERLQADVVALKKAPERPRTALSPEDEKEMDRALGFAERLMQRFFEMVRDLKGDDRPSI